MTRTLKFFGLALIVQLWVASPVTANDQCDDATPVTPGTYSGSTIGADSDGSASCGASGSAPDVWFVYTASEDVILRANTCGSTYDTVLSIHSGCPGTTANQLTCNDDACGLQSSVQVSAAEGQDYYIRVAGFAGASGPFTLEVETLDPGSIMGPDVVYSNCTSTAQFGQVGDIRAYALDSYTCNIGDENLQWGGTTPLLAMNAYRLIDGRIEQIGMSWLKNGTGAAAGSGCGIPCNGQGGSVLGVGCLDVYGAFFNGSQSILGPRSQCNAFTGAYPGASGAAPTVISKRLQIHEGDLMEPAAIYFIEGVYVAIDDAEFGNALNNASYKRVTVSAGSLNLNPVGSIQESFPAIYAWADHGLGVGVSDPSVSIIEVDVPSEGRFFVGTKVTDLGGGQHRYDYAIFNLNSHRSGGSFSVPVAPGVAVTSVDFHDVDYHSGDPYDNTDWVVTVDGSSVTWSSPETFLENENSNALRFATLYSFSFEANAEPQTVDATLGLFRPGTPDSIGFQVPAPAQAVVTEFVRGDCNQDDAFDIADPVALLGNLFPGGTPAPPIECDDACDGNDDGMLNIADAVALLDGLFGSSGSVPAPSPDCGADPTDDALGCASYAFCP